MRQHGYAISGFNKSATFRVSEQTEPLNYSISFFAEIRNMFQTFIISSRLVLTRLCMFSQEIIIYSMLCFKFYLCYLHGIKALLLTQNGLHTQLRSVVFSVYLLKLQLFLNPCLSCSNIYRNDMYYPCLILSNPSQGPGPVLIPQITWFHTFYF